MKREMICIICPKGCALCADMGPEGITVTGNTCPRVFTWTETKTSACSCVWALPTAR